MEMNGNLLVVLLTLKIQQLFSPIIYVLSTKDKPQTSLWAVLTGTTFYQKHSPYENTFR